MQREKRYRPPREWDGDSTGDSEAARLRSLWATVLMQALDDALGKGARKHERNVALSASSWPPRHTGFASVKLYAV